MHIIKFKNKYFFYKKNKKKNNINTAMLDMYWHATGHTFEHVHVNMCTNNK